MKPGDVSTLIFDRQRWKKAYPFLASVFVLAFIIWAVFLSLTSPYDGASMISRNWVVEKVDKAVPGNQLRVNDIILYIDNVPVPAYTPGYASRHVGDSVDVVVLREGQVVPLKITLVRPTYSELVTRLSSLLAAFIFWWIGI